MKKYFILTYGCQQNESDSEKITRILEENNYQPASSAKDADLIIVNACSIRQSAIDRLRGFASKFEKIKKKNKKLKTLLTGCLLEKDRLKLKKYFNFILPIKTLQRWPQIIQKKQYYPFFNPRDKGFNKELAMNYCNINSLSQNKHSALIPISSGCNNFCTYCVVPYTRGPLICRKHQNIIKDVKESIKNGAKEIWLLGENVNDYLSPSNKKIDFPEILKKIDQTKGNFWIRFTSPHPKNFSKKLINQIAVTEKLGEYLNIPIQSGNNEILKAMNRNYTVEDYKKIIRSLRKKVPNIAISTDIIVGFPGETKKQFKDTLSLFQEIGFDMAYIAKYSERKGTEAEKMKKQVSLQEKQRRQNKLTKVLEKSALRNNKKYIGKTIKILINKKTKKYAFGKSRTYKTVRIRSNQSINLGEIIKVKIEEAYPWGLKGKKQLPKLIVILGPTASGKTKMAINLAQKFNGEIISADSKQVYKEIGIGTDKPSQKEQRTVNHHLIDCISLKEDFNVGVYKNLALKAIKKVIRKGKQPFLVGGTGLYLKALTSNFSLAEVSPNQDLRKKLEKKSLKELNTIYQKLDPKGFEKIDRKNKRRVIRAIEVCRETGQPYWEQRNKKDALFDVLKIGIKPKKENLEKRITQRVEKMFKEGLEKEAIGIIRKIGPSASLEIIGYQEWFPYYPDFNLTKEDRKKIKEKIILHTLQFSKRQKTWFKKDKEIQWVKKSKKAEKLIKVFLKNNY